MAGVEFTYAWKLSISNPNIQIPVSSLDTLTSESSDDTYTSAVSECIRYHMEQGDTQEQAAAACYNMAQEKTGREYPEAKQKKVTKYSWQPLINVT